MARRLALVRDDGPRLVEVVGVLHPGASGAREFHEECRMVPRAGTVPVGAVRERSGDLRIDLDVHGSVQADDVLVVTLTLQVRHPGATDGAVALEAETTVVARGGVVPFALTCLDRHGCRAEARGSIVNGG